MGYFQRVKNVAAFMALKVAGWLFFLSPFQNLKVKMGIKPERSYVESFMEKEMTMFMADFAFEYAQPLRPGNDNDNNHVAADDDDDTDDDDDDNRGDAQ